MNIEDKYIKFTDLPIEQLGPDSDFFKNLNLHLDESTYYDNHRYGTVQSTLGFPKSITGSSDWPYLSSVLNEYILKAKNFFNIEAKSSNLIRIWANRMHKGSRVYNHSHSHKPDNNKLVGILYLNAVPNSADFVITTLYNKFLEEQIPPSMKKIIPVNTGDLIFHKINLWHAVAEHKLDEPRLSIIFEVEFKD